MTGGTEGLFFLIKGTFKSNNTGLFSFRWMCQ